MTDESDIDEQLQKPKRSVTYQRNGDGMHRRVLEGLIGVSVVALVAAVWNLTQTVTLHQASIDSQRRDFDRMERRQDMLEGKITRGTLLGESGASDKQ